MNQPGPDSTDRYCRDYLPNLGRLDVVDSSPFAVAFRPPASTRMYDVEHILVASTAHFADLGDAPDTVALEFVRMLGAIGDQVAKDKGYARLIINVGAVQHSKHLHGHVVCGEFIANSQPSRRGQVLRRLRSGANE